MTFIFNQYHLLSRQKRCRTQLAILVLFEFVVRVLEDPHETAAIETAADHGEEAVAPVVKEEKKLPPVKIASSHPAKSDVHAEKVAEEKRRRMNHEKPLPNRTRNQDN